MRSASPRPGMSRGALARVDRLVDSSACLLERATLLAGFGLPLQHIGTLCVGKPGAVLEHARKMRHALAVGAECLRFSRGALRIQHQVVDRAGLLRVVRKFRGANPAAGMEYRQRRRVQFAPPQWRHRLVQRTARQLMAKRQRFPAHIEHAGAHAFFDSGVVGILRQLSQQGLIDNAREYGSTIQRAPCVRAQSCRAR